MKLNFSNPRGAGRARSQAYKEKFYQLSSKNRDKELESWSWHDRKSMKSKDWGRRPANSKLIGRLHFYLNIEHLPHQKILLFLSGTPTNGGAMSLIKECEELLSKAASRTTVSPTTTKPRSNTLFF